MKAFLDQCKGKLFHRGKVEFFIGLSIEMIFLIASLLSTSVLVQSADVPKFIVDAIGEYKKVDTFSYIEYLRGRDEPLNLTEAHKVLRAHCYAVRESQSNRGWMYLWSHIFNSLLDKNYFASAKDGVLAARNAFYKLLVPGSAAVDGWNRLNTKSFMETIKMEIGAYCEDGDFTDLHRLNALMAFIMISHNIGMAKEDKVYQEFLRDSAQNNIRKPNGRKRTDNSYNRLELQGTTLNQIPSLLVPTPVHSSEAIDHQAEVYFLVPNEFGYTRIPENSQYFASPVPPIPDCLDEDFCFVKAIKAAESSEGSNIENFKYLDAAFFSAVNDSHIESMNISDGEYFY